MLSVNFKPNTTAARHRAVSLRQHGLLVIIIFIFANRRHLASGEGVVSLDIRLLRCHALCVSAALVSTAKVMRCIL